MKIALLAVVLATLASSANAPRYAVAGSIAGPDGGWDYTRVDPVARRLYVARGDSVTVIDLDKGMTIASWAPIARGHAVVPLPGDRVLVTSGNDSTVRFLDARDGHQISSIAVGTKPDAAIYDPATKRAFVMNAESGSVSVIDTVSMRVTKTIPVKPALEYAVLAKDGTLFINNEDANEIEVVDVARGKALAAIPLSGCEGPTGMGYDSRANRLITACASGAAAVVDVAKRKVVATIAIGKGADAVIVDDDRHLAFIPCGSDGVLEMLSLSGNAVARIATIPTEKGARTGALDPKTGALYLPTARFAPAAEPGKKRPNMLPGTFHVLKIVGTSD